jgi:putative MATE family efflux protein
VQTLRKFFAPQDMTEGKAWKKLLAFTVPMLIGNLFQQLYSTVDAIIVGRYIGDNALAAVGASIPLFFFMLVLLIGIAMGAGVMVSQYFGANRREDLSHTIGTCLTAMVIVSAITAALGPLGSRPLLVLLNTPEEILDWAVLYINIQLWGILGFAMFNIMAGILRGLGDSFSPLLYLAVASVLNIALDLLFITVFHWGVAGAAFATVIVQTLAALLCLRRLMQMKAVFDFNWYFLKIKRFYLMQVLRLGLPSGASQAVFALAMMVVQPLANSFGAMFIACNIIVMRIDGFVMMPNFSYGNAVTVYAGQNIGAGKMERVRQGTKECLYLAVGTAIVVVAVILLLGRPLAGLFTQTEEILDMTIYMLRILAGGYVMFAVGIVLWGVIRGAGDAMTPMWAAVVNSVIIRVPTAFLFVHLMGRPEALFYSLLAGWTFNTVLAFIAYKRGKWRTKGLVRRESV